MKVGLPTRSESESGNEQERTDIGPEVMTAGKEVKYGFLIYRKRKRDEPVWFHAVVAQG